LFNRTKELIDRWQSKVVTPRAVVLFEFREEVLRDELLASQFPKVN
jgi:hypothetical protein